MNSWADLPPIMPVSDSTIQVARPHRSKIRRYTSMCRSYEASSPSSSRSKLYESFIMNSRVRRIPLFGRGSSRSLVWIWYHTCGSSR